uniref:Saccharolysin n=1 Tax=Talaromyces marneffei PM1 TaxID=1077442 RepID=A0A093V0R2_TALMA
MDPVFSHSKAQDSTLAHTFRFRVALLSLLLFFSIFLVLTSNGTALDIYIRLGSSFSRPLSTSYPQPPLSSGNIAAIPYNSPPQHPPLFTATNESLISDAQRICARKLSLLDQLTENTSPDAATFDSVLLPIAQEEDAAMLERRIIGFYQDVSTNCDLRDASSEAQQIIEECDIEAYMREDIFSLVQAVWDKSQKGGSRLDGESFRLLKKERKSYIRNGLGIEKGPKRDRFKEIKRRLSQLSIQFQKNLNEENGGVWFMKPELEGVPEDVLSGLELGTGENEGKVKVSFDYTDLFPALKFALHGETRQKLYVQNENKLNQNVPLFREAIILRDEAARLLGYPDHASFRIEDKMAESAESVISFLGDLKERLTPGGAKEVAHLSQLKSEDLKSRGLAHTNDGNYYLWDDRFYDQLMVSKEFSFDEQLIAEYFPLQSTIEGMLAIFEELMGFVFVELGSADGAKISPTGKSADITWHEDVKIFSVWDDEGEGNGFVGYFYMDLHPRPGKFGHAANFALQPGFILPNGTRRYPATALVCNFSKPAKDKPSLLKHDEIVLLFHELGHGIHDLAGRTRYSQFHGTNVVRDFVEAPSQMLEYWCWNSSVLKSLSKHYKTGEQIPDNLIAKLISTKHVNGALDNLHQLHFGIFDMEVHTPRSHKESESINYSELYNDIRAQTYGLKGLEALGVRSDWGHGEAIFGHLMGEYDAGYYGIP